ncbi:hypothetical protein KV605_40000 [Rhodococcus opacus]|nr:hypothetical protein [Rhodococcus opacus]
MPMMRSRVDGAVFLVASCVGNRKCFTGTVTIGYSRVDAERRRLRHLLRYVGAGACGLLIAGSVAVAAPGTACACSCVSSETPEEAVSYASGVFVARATEKISDGFVDTYEFEVSEVFKGEVGSTTTVGTLANGNGCGTSYQVGEQYLLFVSRPYQVDAAWEGYACGPYTGAPFDIRAVTEEVYGSPHSPRESAPESEISWQNRITAAVPTPILVAADVVLLGVIGWGISVVRRRRSGGVPWP